MYRVRVVISAESPKAAQWLWPEMLRVYAGAVLVVAGKNPLEVQFSAWATALDFQVAETGKLVDCDIVAVLHQRLFAEGNRDGRERRVFEQALRKIAPGGTVEHWYFTPGVHDEKVAWRFIHRPKPERDGGNDCFANLVMPGRVEGAGRNEHHVGAAVATKSRTGAANKGRNGRHG